MDTKRYEYDRAGQRQFTQQFLTSGVPSWVNHLQGKGSTSGIDY
jgi:hypothetical protein